jgi:hypothetical protein
MVAIWREQETCSFSRREGFAPVSVEPPLASFDVGVSSANGEALSWQPLFA